MAAARRTGGRATRRPADPGVRRALEAALAAAQLPDHPRLDQVFDVFVEGDGLWIVSELLPARPLASLLAERPLSPHRAAEIGADLVAALRAVHAQGWTHRNLTARTVLVCDDGHAMLTGLAAGAAEETLCGYDVLPRPAEEVAEAAALPLPPGRQPSTDGGEDKPGPGSAPGLGSPPDGSPGEGPAVPSGTGPGGPAGGGAGRAAERSAGPSAAWETGGAGAGSRPDIPWWQGGSADGGTDAPDSAAGTPGDDGPAGAPWWQVGAGQDASARPVRGAPWDEAAPVGEGGDAHAYGAAEQRPGRPHEADGPAARAARRGAIAAYHAGTRAAAEHRAGGHPAARTPTTKRWPFAPARRPFAGRRCR